MFVTQNWSGRRSSLRPPWTDNFQFVVSGTFDQDVALAAVPFQLNSPHPDNPYRLKCSGPVVQEAKGPEYFVINCPFSEPDGGRHKQHPADPLMEPPSIGWQQCEVMEQVDHDLANRVIANSAGDVQTAPRRIVYMRLVIVRNLPFFDLTLQAKYANTVNAAPFQLSTGISVATEHMRCAEIIPAVDSYHPLVEFMPMRFVFDVMAEGVLGDFPWQHRLLDAGRNGWYNSSGKKSGIFTSGKEPVDFDVKLNGYGQPLTQPYSSNIKVGDRGGNNNLDPVEPPIPMRFYKQEFYANDGGFLDGQDLGEDSISDAILAETASVFNYFEAVRAVDFSPLADLIDGNVAPPDDGTPGVNG